MLHSARAERWLPAHRWVQAPSSAWARARSLHACTSVGSTVGVTPVLHERLFHHESAKAQASAASQACVPTQQPAMQAHHEVVHLHFHDGTLGVSTAGETQQQAITRSTCTGIVAAGRCNTRQRSLDALALERTARGPRPAASCAEGFHGAAAAQRAAAWLPQISRVLPRPAVAVANSQQVIWSTAK